MTSVTLATGSIPTHMAASNMSRQSVSARGGIAMGLASGRVSQSIHPSTEMVGAKEIFSSKHFLQQQKQHYGRRQTMQLHSKVILLFCLGFFNLKKILNMSLGR